MESVKVCRCYCIDPLRRAAKRTKSKIRTGPQSQKHVPSIVWTSDDKSDSYYYEEMIVVAVAVAVAVAGCVH